MEHIHRLPVGGRGLRVTRALLLSVALLAAALSSAAEQDPPRYIIETDLGEIHIELLPESAPVTVENFITLAGEGFYDGLIFHRVIAGFMVQTGGFDDAMTRKRSPRLLPNESMGGPKNKRGTLAMARLNDPNSASSQFFINLKHNRHLDAKRREPGFTVFGHVIDGMDTVKSIELSDTHIKAGMPDVPETPIRILGIRPLVEPPAAAAAG